MGEYFNIKDCLEEILLSKIEIKKQQENIKQKKENVKLIKERMNHLTDGVFKYLKDENQDGIIYKELKITINKKQLKEKINKGKEIENLLRKFGVENVADVLSQILNIKSTRNLEEDEEILKIHLK